LLVSVVQVDRPAPWIDEAATAHALRRDWLDLAELLLGRDAPLVPYYVAQKIGFDITSLVADVDPWAFCRWTSALAAAACVGLLARWLTQRSWSLAVLASALLVAFTGFERYAQEARPYALLMLATTWCWLEWWGRMTGSGGRRYAASVAAIALVNVFGLAHVLVQGALAVRAARGGDEAADRACRAVRWGLLWSAPWILWTAVFGTGAADTVLPRTVERVGRSAARMISGPGAPALTLVVIALAVAAVIGTRHRCDSRLVALAVAWALASPVVVGLVGLVVNYVALQPRYWVASVPGCAVLAALGVHHAASAISGGRAVLQQAAVGVLAAAVIAAVVAAELPGQREIRRADGHGEDVRPALAAAEAVRDAPILLTSGSSALVVGELDRRAQRRIAGWDVSTGRFVSEVPWPEARLTARLRTEPRALLFVRIARADGTSEALALLSRRRERYLPTSARVAGLTRGRVLHQSGSWVVYLLKRN
jgi:hypothetical protein